MAVGPAVKVMLHLTCWSAAGYILMKMVTPDPEEIRKKLPNQSHAVSSRETKLAVDALKRAANIRDDK